MKRQITRVVIENYRSIRRCDVRLGPLTLLVGPNGTGKSNVLDALRFVVHSLHAPFDQVLAARSGILGLAYRAPGGGTTSAFTIELEMSLENGVAGTYSIVCDWESNDEFSVSERCLLSSGSRFEIRKGDVLTSTVPAPALTGDRPGLVAFGGHEEFASVFRMLSEMTFYAPDPASIKEPRRPAAAKVLSRNAENLADVLALSVPERIEHYLAVLLPSVRGLHVQTHQDAFRELQFRVAADGDGFEQLFGVTNMSDGTLRSLAVLTALFQPSLPLRPVSLVGLEEPENNLHPAAAGILVDAMLEASVDVQVIATTHSADLLDHPELPLDAILTVEMEKGESIIAPLGETTREIVRRKLYTPGELLRNRQLWPESGA